MDAYCTFSFWTLIDLKEYNKYENVQEVSAIPTVSTCMRVFILKSTQNGVSNVYLSR